MATTTTKRSTGAGVRAARILAVEDQADIAEFLATYFVTTPHTLIHVDPERPADIIAAVEEHQPDLVLLDLQLRGFKSNDAYRELRRRPGLRSMPIIMCTALPDRPEELSLVKGDVLLRKPFSVTGLEEAIAERLEYGATVVDVPVDDTAEPVPALVWARLDRDVSVAAKRDTAVTYAVGRILDATNIEISHGSAGMARTRQAIIERLRAALPEGALVAPTDLDEIGVVIPAVDSATAVEMIERFVHRFNRSGLRSKEGHHSRLAFGVAGFPTQAGNVDQLLDAADAALVEATDDEIPVHLSR